MNKIREAKRITINYLKVVITSPLWIYHRQRTEYHIARMTPFNKHCYLADKHIGKLQRIYDWTYGVKQEWKR